MMDEIIAYKEPVADMDDTVKRFNLLNIKFRKNGSVASYTVNEEKKDAPAKPNVEHQELWYKLVKNMLLFLQIAKKITRNTLIYSEMLI